MQIILRGGLYLDKSLVECFKQVNFDLVKSLFETCWKSNGFGLQFIENFSNTSLNKSSWNNWLVLKRMDRCQLLAPGWLVDVVFI